jgi:hypothetical protein
MSLTRKKLTTWTKSVRTNPEKLQEDLTEKFGTPFAVFNVIEMPNLGGHLSVGAAVEGGVSAETIADHFDKFYPCSDEQ